jgi:proline iminopeptidase
MATVGGVSEQTTQHGLFADIRGDADSSALLFLHGGPGQGAYEFMAVQGDRLGTSLRVIGLDQRGVDRSAPLPAAAGLTIIDLVKDCEAVRQALGIERWAVLGHSFGGMLALCYATSYPGAVSAVIFENPVWDITLTTRSALPRIASMLESLGREPAARAALTAASADCTPPEMYAAYRTALDALGDQREGYFIPDPATRLALHRIRLARLGRAPSGGAPVSDSTARHHAAIVEEAVGCESWLPLLPRLGMPALLITGDRDPTTSPEQREAFCRGPVQSATVQFDGAGHFVHADRPDPYARAVIAFIRGNLLRSAERRALICRGDRS